MILRPLYLLLALMLMGCAAVGEPGPQQDPFVRGLWPLYTGDRRPWAEVSEHRSLGPFVHWESNVTPQGVIGERLFELRPLYSTRRRTEETRHDLLYPTAVWRVRPERTQGWFLWLGRFRHDVATGAEETFLGLAYRGRTKESSGYAGFFPLIGNLVNRFGFDRIGFVLWPLYAKARRGGYSEVQILWPFFAYGWGDGHKKLRLWPLYGYEERKGIESRRFFLWPLVHHRLRRLDTERPERAFYVLPFFGRRDAGPVHMRFYLFPLFSRQWNDAREGVFQTDVLWPIFSRKRDAEGGRGLALRPLVETYRGPSRSRWSLGLGLLGRTTVHTEEVEEETWRILWTGRAGWRRDPIHETRRRDFWPLFRSLERREGDSAAWGFLRVPTLLPMRALEPDGWDRHYNKLFEIYGVRWRGEERRSSLLWGLREGRDSPEESWVSWFGFLHLRR